MPDHVGGNSEQELGRASPTRHEKADQQLVPPNERAHRAGRRYVRPSRLAAVAVAIIVLLAVVVLVAGGSDAPPKPGSAQANATEHGITRLLTQIPQRANTLGQTTAPVTLRWYGDLECPYCKKFALGALPSIIRRWVRGGQLKIEYLSMETATSEPKVFETQQVAALAAGMQDKMWNYIETFYHEQGEEDTGYVTEQYLHGLATQIPGLNVNLWREDRYDPELAARVQAERAAAKHAHYRGTPTFLIGKTNGPISLLPLRSPTDPLTTPRLFDEVIERTLRLNT
jgi:protein-disulfide isomerase